jgi:flagellar biosynthetic protein FliR
VFPPGQSVALLDLVDVIVQAGSTMLVLALKLGAPILAGFLLVSVILGVLARVMPEMNILMASFPMRVTAGMVLSLVVLGTMKSFVAEIVDTFEQLLF